MKNRGTVSGWSVLHREPKLIFRCCLHFSKINNTSYFNSCLFSFIVMKKYYLFIELVVCRMCTHVPKDFSFLSLLLLLFPLLSLSSIVNNSRTIQDFPRLFKIPWTIPKTTEEIMRIMNIRVGYCIHHGRCKMSTPLISILYTEGTGFDVLKISPSLSLV